MERDNRLLVEELLRGLLERCYLNLLSLECELLFTLRTNAIVTLDYFVRCLKFKAMI